MTRDENIAAFEEWIQDKTYREVVGEHPSWDDPACAENPVVIWMKEMAPRPFIEAPAPQILDPMSCALGVVPLTLANKQRQAPHRSKSRYDLVDQAAKDPAAAKVLLDRAKWEVEGWNEGLHQDEVEQLMRALGPEEGDFLRECDLRIHGYGRIQGVTEENNLWILDEGPIRACLKDGKVVDVMTEKRVPGPSYVFEEWVPFEDNITREIWSENHVLNVFSDEIIEGENGKKVVRTYQIVPTSSLYRELTRKK